MVESLVLLAAILGAISILSYAFIYTPLKKQSSIAVFVGAIPGALPTAIGYVCATYPVTFNLQIVALSYFLFSFYGSFRIFGL
jgi:protoheme IX farnesyltransferase